MTHCRLKPGSLTADGIVVGVEPVRNPWQEPVIVPADFGVSLGRTIARCRALDLAGWVRCPAALQPRILNRNEDCLIHRESRAMQRWLALSPERRRAGAGQ